MTMLRAIVSNGAGESFVAKHGAMKLMCGQAAEEFGDFSGADFESIVESLTLGKFRESGSRGNGAGAAISFPFDVFDFVVFDLEKHFHLIATNRVADNPLSIVRVFGFVAHQEVARVQKMLFDDIGIDPAGIGGIFAGVVRTGLAVLVVCDRGRIGLI